MSQTFPTNNNSHPSNLIFFDLETTGLNQYHDSVTEIAMIRENFNDEENQLEFVTLVNPEKNITPFITRITGISNEMVLYSPKFKEVIPNILSFVAYNSNTPYLVAHNCDGFDKLVLRIHFKKGGINLNEYPWKYLDTLLMAKQLYPYFNKHNLKSLMEQLGLPVENAHRARNDTVMMRNLYHRMCQDLAKQKNLTPEYVLNNPEYVWNYINN